MEADGLYDVLAVSQDVVCDSPGKQRVTLPIKVDRLGNVLESSSSYKK